MKQAEIKEGNRFGAWTALAYHGRDDKHRELWNCKCGCGKEVIVRGDNLQAGKSRSCGCRIGSSKEHYRLRKNKEFLATIGHKFGAMENHPNWKGGRTEHDGYVKFMNKKHPRANKDGYVYEHILVMEKMLGRQLNNGEVIHHCNQDVKDNRPYNLRLFKNNGEHIRYHNTHKHQKPITPSGEAS
ncbi:MAG: HNH endonuclease [Syntrophaceae bacterium]